MYTKKTFERKTVVSKNVWNIIEYNVDLHFILNYNINKDFYRYFILVIGSRRELYYENYRNLKDMISREYMKFLEDSVVMRKRNKGGCDTHTYVHLHTLK